MEYRIGAGGWAYFKVSGMDPLVAYSKAFNFVEVNSTFYEYPSQEMTKSWRRRVPKNFEFTVRCHRDLTHLYALEPVEGSLNCLERMVKICNILNAELLHIQTPSSFDLDKDKVESIRDLFASAELRGVRLAWEVRKYRAKPLPSYLVHLMNDFDIIHCVDLSREEPAFFSEILYSRLFGKGKHNLWQFDDFELREINRKATKEKPKRIYLNFHGARMYKDAARHLVFTRTGKFPRATKSIGLGSLEEVLREDARFPSTKEKLIEQQGWKVIDLTENKRVHAGEILGKLPDYEYKNIEDVVQMLRSQGYQ